VKLHHERTGTGGPVLVLSNSLGTNLHIWDAMMDDLTAHFDVIRYDQRGHGRSPHFHDPYTVADLGKDLVELMDDEAVDRAYFCGVSMGGLTGLWLGVHRPDRLLGLILSNTASKIGTDETWNDRIHTVLECGLEPIGGVVVSGWVSAVLRNSDPVLFQGLVDMLLEQDPASYAAACGAVRDADFSEAIAGIEVPTLVIAGTYDSPTPPGAAHALASAIPGAHYATVSAAHVSPIEAPRQYADALVGFIKDQPTKDHS
jgi:3-oxoadipate enol-lactonase